MSKVEKIPDCHTKLLPCPFCGNDNIHITKRALWWELDDGRVRSGYKDRYEFEVVCDECGAHPTYTKNDTIYYSAEEAISHAVNTWNKRVQNSFLESLFSDAKEAKGQCDWALIYEYARSMKNCIDDNDKGIDVYIEECIDRIEELAIEHGGNRIDQIMHDDEDHEDIKESCIKVINEANWLLTRTLDIEKREKLYSISLEATKVLRKLVNTP